VSSELQDPGFVKSNFKHLKHKADHAAAVWFARRWIDACNDKWLEAQVEAVAATLSMSLDLEVKKAKIKAELDTPLYSFTGTGEIERIGLHAHSLAFILSNTHSALTQELAATDTFSELLSQDHSFALSLSCN
jgi:hypothetical protein